MWSKSSGVHAVSACRPRLRPAGGKCGFVTRHAFDRGLRISGICKNSLNRFTSDTKLIGAYQCRRVAQGRIGFEQSCRRDSRWIQQRLRCTFMATKSTRMRSWRFLNGPERTETAVMAPGLLSGKPLRGGTSASYVPGPEPDSVFVVTAYELVGKPLGAFRKRKKKKHQ